MITSDMKSIYKRADFDTSIDVIVRCWRIDCVYHNQDIVIVIEYGSYLVYSNKNITKDMKDFIINIVTLDKIK